jgi:hypothetical protein
MLLITPYLETNMDFPVSHLVNPLGSAIAFPQNQKLAFFKGFLLVFLVLSILL